MNMGAFIAMQTAQQVAVRGMQNNIKKRKEQENKKLQKEKERSDKENE